MPEGSQIRIRASAEADISTPDTDQVAIFIDSDDSNTPAYKDDGGVVHSMVGADGADGVLTYQDHGNTGSTETVDASVAIVHRLVLNASGVTITLTGAATAGTPTIIRLKLVGDGSTTVTVTWPGSVSWGTPGAPTMLTTGTVIVDLETEDGGTTWLGVQAGRPGATGASGSNGANGGAIVIPYTFSTTTTDSDPGSGNLRLDNATQTSATTIRADLLSSDTTDWSAVLATFADSTNTVKGYIRLYKASDTTKWLLFTVSALASPSGYKNITVANVSGSSSSPFSNSDAIILAFERVGDAGGGGGAPSTATYVTTTADGTLSAEVVHPELGNYNGGSPSAIDMSAASTGTGVSLLGTANWNAHGKWTTSGSINYLDVASSIGTANFDVRARVAYSATGSTIADSYGGFFVTDGSRTTATMLGLSALPRLAGGAAPTLRGRTGNSASGTNLFYIPLWQPHIQRIVRTGGTTYTYYASFNEGASWIQIETGTSSLNVGKIGFWMDTNTGTAVELMIDWVRSY